MARKQPRAPSSSAAPSSRTPKGRHPHRPAPLIGRARQRRAALHQARRCRGAARDRLSGARRELGHLHARRSATSRSDRASRGFTVGYDATLRRCQGRLAYRRAISHARPTASQVRRVGDAEDRFPDRPHRLRRAASAERRGRQAGRRRACRRQEGQGQVPGDHQSGAAVPRHPRAHDARGRCRA